MLLPAPERRGELHFHVAKGLSYRARFVLAFLFIMGGWLTQYFFFESGPWQIGFALLLAGVCLLLVRGFDNSIQRYASSKDWKPATRTEVERILELNRKQRKWDQAIVDITNPLGLLSFIVLVLVCVGAWYAIVRTQDWNPSKRHLTIVALNLTTLIVPFWLTGIRSILKNDRLVIKAEMFLKLHDAFRKQLGKEGETFQYQMQTAKVKKQTGEVPVDVKAIVQFTQAPSEFLGLQMQISINSVQGTDYPYCYCVLVAKKEFGRITKGQVPPPPANILLEPSRDEDVEIMVIRQRTTKNSGYHTNAKAAQRIFEYALKAARQVVGTPVSGR